METVTRARRPHETMGTAGPRTPARIRALPFAAVALGALAVVPFGPVTSPTHVVAGALGTFLLLAVIAAVPWDRAPAWTKPLPALAYLGVIGLLRFGAGGASSGLGILTALPVLWLALYAGPRVLSLGIALTAAEFVVPILLVGAPAYPEAEWRRAILNTVVLALVGGVVHRLVTQLRLDTATTAREARIDPLTGLVNRRGFAEQLGRELARARRNRAPLSLLMLDLDGFKAFNDRHGHLAGDRLLAETASAWTAIARETDVIGRQGGEEFVVLLPDTPIDAATRVAERLRVVVPGSETCSVGVVQWDGREAPDVLLHRSDDALYDAKRAGRDRVVAHRCGIERTSDARVVLLDRIA